MATKSKERSRLTARTAERLTQNYKENPSENTGGEVEDAILHSETHEGASNDVAEQILHNIYEDAKVEAEKNTVNSEDNIIGVELTDSPLNAGEGFNPAIDTDFSPHQGEVASAVVTNPADLIFGVDRPRRIRDRNLPNDYSSFELGLKKETMFPDVEGPHSLQAFVKNDPNADEDNRRPKPRYLGFVENDGSLFHAMGAPTATQLNTGTTVGENIGADEFFFRFFNGGSNASVPELSPAVSSLFNADPVFKENDDEYEIAVDSGRDMIYDLFVAESNAVSRKEAESRWGDVLDEALPTNQNYGHIQDFTEITSVEDFVSIVASRPAKLAPEIDPGHVKLGDELEEETLEEYQQSKGLEKEDTWALFDQSREEMNLDSLEEKRSYAGKLLLEDEIVEVTVDHSEMSENEFDQLLDSYFDIQNSMVRPDVAPKTNGVVEVRDFTHSDRTYEALITQKAFVQKHEEVQRIFAEAGVDSQTAPEFREDVVRNGLDAEMPGYEIYGSKTSLRDFYRFELLPVLEDGVREAFSDETPYVVQKLVENEDYDDFTDDVLHEFNNFGEFLEYQELVEEVDYRPGTVYREEASEFRDWFVDRYSQEMRHWLDPDMATVNEEILEEANLNGPDSAVNLKKRGSQSSYEGVE